METAAGGVTLPAGALASTALREAYAQSSTRMVAAAFWMRFMAGCGRHEPSPLHRPQDSKPGVSQRQDAEDRQQLWAAGRA